MTARRALVVDDSRSARAFLTRILERNDLAVDAVESAEQAIDYLAQQRPDVIFMDHLMPGMDGFQALQAIKANPHTATIPIMMYTSQEGELYLSQARALGAIGVLPKQIKHADVSKALEQLNLRPEPRPEHRPEPDAGLDSGLDIEPSSQPQSRSQSGARPDIDSQAATVQVRAVAAEGESPPAAERRAAGRPVLPTVSPELRTLMEAMLSHHGRELRRFVVDTVENQGDRIVADVRLLLQDAVQGSAAEPPRSPARSRPVAPWLAAAALLAAIAFGLLWWQQGSRTAAVTAQLAVSRQQAEQVQRMLSALQAATATASRGGAAADAGVDPTDATDAAAGTPAAEAGATATGATAGAAAGAAAAGTAAAGAQGSGARGASMVEPVPFGETPLAGARLEQVSQLLSRLNAQGFRGVVQIRSFPGRYCMVSGPSGAPALAASALPYAKCEQVGNPRDEDSSEHQSIAFADMIATARASADGRLDIQISSGGADEVVAPYPPISDSLTAGEWNRIAAANNRVELHWQAAR
jgi:CheY-like chemotaxis protein